MKAMKCQDGFRNEFKLIDIKDINKILRLEKCGDSFGGGMDSESNVLFLEVAL